ncbi:MAG: hypothetical protein ACRYFU_00520 [Janthinobacterium lividum]
MKGKLFLSLLLAAAPVTGYASEQLVPGGSMIQCTVSEPKISSKTESIGDPVLCQVSHVELYGRSVFPYGSYLEGRFEDYKDPGHFVGRGWMELKFDRLIVRDTVIPIAAKVVYVPKYPVDKEGRIHGTGHPVRDTIEWAIPVLWPIDLINLPRRGPRPTLKPETRLTLKVMDDFGIPSAEPYQSPALVSRAPQYAPPPQQYAPPQQQYYNPPVQPMQYQYAPPPPRVQQTVVYQYAPPPQAIFVSAPVLYGYVPPPPPPPVLPAAYGYGYTPYGALVSRARFYSPYGPY